MQSLGTWGYRVGRHQCGAEGCLYRAVILGMGEAGAGGCGAGGGGCTPMLGAAEGWMGCDQCVTSGLELLSPTVPQHCTIPTAMG